MKSHRQILLLLLWCLFAGAAPAYANNAPQPDGMFSLILIFPVAILGFRLAGAKLTDKQRKRRVMTGLALALCTLLCMAGTEIALIPLLLIIGYGVMRGIQAMKGGQGKRSAALGVAIIVFTLFGVANYITSTNYLPEGSMTAAGGHATLQDINEAELKFKSTVLSGAAASGSGEFGTLEQLHAAGLLTDVDWEHLHGPHYRYFLVLTGNPAEDAKHYFVYATPVRYGRPIPTLSLLRALLPRAPYAQRTLASDETGVIRAADLGGSRPVTRAEAEKWQQF